MELPTKLDTTNRRIARRKLPRGTVRVECSRPGEDMNIATGLLDLCEGGVRLLLGEAVEVHEELQIQFEAFGVPKIIKRSARVAWSLPLPNRQFAAGLEFRERLSSDEVQQLSRS